MYFFAEKLICFKTYNVTMLLYREVMSSPTVTLREVPSVRSVCMALSDPDNCHSGYPVTDEDGKFRGFILRSQLLVLLRHKVRFLWKK